MPAVDALNHVIHSQERHRTIGVMDVSADLLDPLIAFLSADHFHLRIVGSLCSVIHNNRLFLQMGHLDWQCLERQRSQNMSDPMNPSLPRAIDRSHHDCFMALSVCVLAKMELQVGYQLNTPGSVQLEGRYRGSWRVHHCFTGFLLPHDATLVTAVLKFRYVMLIFDGDTILVDGDPILCCKAGNA